MGYGMRINTLVTLGASAAFGIMSIFLARGWINDAVAAQFTGVPKAQNSPALPAISTVPVLVADLDLNFGDTLLAQNLRVVDMPEDIVPLGSFTNFDSLFGPDGARTVVLARMRANEAILDYKISGPGGRGSLSAVITDGMRAAAIRVNAVAGVGGFVLPGDYVDVILTRDMATGEQDRKLTSDILLQNVKVLGADQNADTAASSVKVAQTVTLEVTPFDAQKLTLAMDLGTLSLTLRQTGEMQIDPVASLNEKNLTGPARSAPARRTTYAAKPAVRKPAQAPSAITAKVTIMRSGKSENVSVRKELTAGSDASRPSETLAGANKLPAARPAGSKAQNREEG